MTNVFPASLIDATLLKPETSGAEVESFCTMAAKLGCAAVVVRPEFVAQVADLLKGSLTRVCSVVDFPEGSSPLQMKLSEAENVLSNGADEIDLVINRALLGLGRDPEVTREVRDIAALAHRHGKILKAILETSELSAEEKRRAAKCARDGGADFIKTSTGFKGGGATVEDVELIAEVTKGQCGIKPSGGIRTRADAIKLLQASGLPPDPRVFRIGTSNPKAIIEGISGQFEGY